MNSTMIYAHRGANRELPENTMESFSRAIELGADALEIDVHMSRDGVVVVAHDEHGQRMAGEGAYIRATQWSALRGWDVGRTFVHSTPESSGVSAGAYRMPMLEDVLGTFKDTFINIDIKQLHADAVPQTVRSVIRAGATDRVRLTSFSKEITRRIAASAYRGVIGASRFDVMRFLALPRVVLARAPMGFDSLQIPPRFAALALATPRLIAKAQKLGLHVDFWTVNDPFEAKRLFGLGARGIVTDDIRTLASALRPSPKTP